MTSPLAIDTATQLPTGATSESTRLIRAIRTAAVRQDRIEAALLAPLLIVPSVLAPLIALSAPILALIGQVVAEVRSAGDD